MRSGGCLFLLARTLLTFCARWVFILNITCWDTLGFSHSGLSRPRAHFSRNGGSACTGRTLRSQLDPSSNVPSDQLRRKKPLLQLGTCTSHAHECESIGASSPWMQAKSNDCFFPICCIGSVCVGCFGKLGILQFYYEPIEHLCDLGQQMVEDSTDC